jgi:hypothetical protein
MLSLVLTWTLSICGYSQNQAPQSSGSATLRGRVVDARTGEPVSKVRIIVTGAQTHQSVTTDEKGAFSLQNLQAGELELYITTVGYGLVKRSVLLNGKEEIEIALQPEAATITEQVTVTVKPFEEIETNAVSEQILNKTELQALSSVLVGDPLRAAQVLPGVSANDDFRSEFAVRGAGPRRVGIYVDGILTDNFVHTVQGNFPDTGSLSVVNADTISAVSLLAGAFPLRYGDRTAAVLSLETRDGNRVKPSGRISASISSASGVLDGPFAKGKGTWLVAARKSYLGYVLRRINDENENSNDTILDFADVQGKAVYDLSTRHQVGASLILGGFQFHRNRPRNKLGPNNVLDGDSRNLLFNTHWSYTPHPKLFVQTRLFFLRTAFTNTNPDELILDDGNRTQLGARSDINYLSGAHRIEAGLYLRSQRVENFSERFFFSQPAPRDLMSFDHHAGEQSFYAQDTWTSERLGLQFTGGGRVDHSGLTGETLFSPRVSMGLTLSDVWRVRAAFGRNHQFPFFEELFGRLGNTGLRAEHATHYNLSVERTFGDRMRVLAEIYDREDSNLVFSLSEPRIEAGRLTFTEFPFRNSLSGHARGLELTLQRRSANGLTGWISYSFSKTRLRDTQSGLSFPSDFDQRHTVNVYSSYRLTETFNLSGQWRYGSGMPIPGFFQEIGPDLFLASERNRVRVPAYSRLDVRASKAFLFDRWKLTLTGEVLNVFNRRNVRYAGFEGFFGVNGQVFGNLDRLLPFLPSAGIVIEF